MPRVTLLMLLLLAACGRAPDQSDALRDAANQSDPAAARVLNEAAENGMDAQSALQEAGSTATMNDTAGPPSGSLGARPNLPGSPNRPELGEPVEKVVIPPSGAGGDGR